MEIIRKPFLREEKLIELLIKKSGINFPADWKDKISVSEMNDGKMGSLKLIPNNFVDKNRFFGKQISEYQFTDSDNVEVIVSLNIDKEGYLFELDIWKTDFSPLITHPKL
jgi:hypothetical protein